MIRQRKGAFPVAVIGLVTRGRHYPVVPAYIAEVHVERVAPAVAIAFAAPLLGAALGPAGQRVTLPVVAKGHQERAQLLPVLAGLPVQRAADSHVAALVTRRLVEVQNLHRQPVVREVLASPTQHRRAHVEALPARRVVAHEPRIQELRDELPRPRGLQHLVHVYPVKPPPAVGDGLVDLVAVEPQFGGGQQLVLRDAAEVEQEAQRRGLAIVRIVHPLHVLWEEERGDGPLAAEFIHVEKLNSQLDFIYAHLTCFHEDALRDLCAPNSTGR